MFSMRLDNYIILKLPHKSGSLVGFCPCRNLTCLVKQCFSFLLSVSSYTTGVSNILALCKHVCYFLLIYKKCSCVLRTWTVKKLDLECYINEISCWLGFCHLVMWQCILQSCRGHPYTFLSTATISWASQGKASFLTHTPASYEKQEWCS